MVTFIGIVGAADRQVPTPIGYDTSTTPRTPIYHSDFPYGFLIAVEFMPGMSHRPVATSTFNSDPGNPNVLPDFQIKSDMKLGNGSCTICDTAMNNPPPGGVPADTMDGEAGLTCPGVSGAQFDANVINDFSCRFDVRQTSDTACTNNQHGLPAFYMMGSTIQFCTPLGVGSEIAFPQHTRTRITAHARDNIGQPGPPASMIVEIE